uniref:Bestrophin homolog n=1 Tax=Panagrolaimus sp. ES5 TaxID=591445 RepID=A0AC34FKE6_9BILA
MLGFFVTFVVSRWLAILNGIGWIDNSAMAFATFIHGEDENTKLLRRTLIRYMVLNQALVLRDISMQVRKRFPTLETLIAAGLLTSAECKLIESINDHYSRYWVPLQWCHQHLCKARADAKIPNDNLLGRTLAEIHTFQQGLATLLKFDWVPVPLIYPQLIFMSVRIYFILYVFWNETQIAPLYTKKTAKRYVSPLIGSAAGVNLLNGATTIKMMPHQNVLNTLNDSERKPLINIEYLEKNF